MPHGIEAEHGGVDALDVIGDGAFVLSIEGLFEVVHDGRLGELIVDEAQEVGDEA